MLKNADVLISEFLDWSNNISFFSKKEWLVSAVLAVQKYRIEIIYWANLSLFLIMLMLSCMEDWLFF